MLSVTDGLGVKARPKNVVSKPQILRFTPANKQHGGNATGQLVTLNLFRKRTFLANVGQRLLFNSADFRSDGETLMVHQTGTS